MRYENCGVMGFGKMPADCTQILLNHHVRVKFLLETEESPFSALESFCRKNSIPYKKCSSAEGAAFLSELIEPTVILSINNNFIFPRAVVQKENLRIVNFHNALLPSYPGHGRSIPQWIVYHGETSHGVTWHLVNDRLDAGHILCSETFPVSEKDTALTLMSRSIRIGIALFERCWEQFLDSDYRGTPQAESAQTIYKSPGQNRMYRKSDIPNDGYLDPSWDFDQCLRFLRSMDYYRLQLIDPPKIAIEDGVRSIRSHRVDGVKGNAVQGSEGKGSEKAEQTYRLHYDKGTITLYLQDE